jgi:hypothetical protein
MIKMRQVMGEAGQGITRHSGMKKIKAKYVVQLISLLSLASE